LLVRDAFGLILNSGLQAGGPKAPDGEKGRVGAGGSPVKPKVEEATASDGSVEDKGQKKGKGKSAKPPVEPPKDYVHVRARRGQATDSHSLAERVRHCSSTRFSYHFSLANRILVFGLEFTIAHCSWCLNRFEERRLARG